MLGFWGIFASALRAAFRGRILSEWSRQCGSKKFPHKFSQSLSSEYLQGNIVNAVADGSAPHPSVSNMRISTPSGVPCPSARKWAPLMIRFSSALSLIIAGQAWNGDGSLSGSK